MVKDLAIDAIAIKAAQGHPDHPVTEAEVDFLLAQIQRLQGEIRHLRTVISAALDEVEDSPDEAHRVLKYEVSLWNDRDREVS